MFEGRLDHWIAQTAAKVDVIANCIEEEERSRCQNLMQRGLQPDGTQLGAAPAALGCAAPAAVPTAAATAAEITTMNNVECSKTRVCEQDSIQLKS